MGLNGTTAHQSSYESDWHATTQRHAEDDMHASTHHAATSTEQGSGRYYPETGMALGAPSYQ